MAETHLLMNVGAFIAAMWWTKSWLMDPIQSRWRFVVASLVSVPLWIFVAYSSTRVVDPSSGVGHVFGSIALAYVAGIMALVSVVGCILGLYLWAEEEAEESAQQLPPAVRPRSGD